MTRKEKINVLEWYCDHCGDTCDTCELKNMYDKETDGFTDSHSWHFHKLLGQALYTIHKFYQASYRPCH